MKKYLSVLIMAICILSVFAQDNSQRPYVPFVYGTYSQGQRVRLDFDRDKEIDYIDFTWSDESEDRRSRVELYVDYLYQGSKSIYSSWGTFYIRRQPKYKMELRISQGKVRIRRAYIYYRLNSVRDTGKDVDLFVDALNKKGVDNEKAIELLNSMPFEEFTTVLAYVAAERDDQEDAKLNIVEEYNQLIEDNNDCIDIRNILYKGEKDREYVFASGHYYNGSTIYLNLEKGRKIRSININWRKEKPIYGDEDPYSYVTGTLYIDGSYQGSKTIRSYSYDTFYIFGQKEMNYSARIQISGGDVYVSSVYVNYAE
ncbi:MAG: hypothetical protein C0601_07195 [Candidatus Muiribacterium halophilum]|uniref:Uncharacterized protein n=1 Tax=Muiribacterium halophilum TaxID=2053465 RepID=A0A2N5ZFX0_MUIH1|nr:MAG: hypothetical protein C0601_07195 [Candidatus Muirbacterium halophilum]